MRSRRKFSCACRTCKYVPVGAHTVLRLLYVHIVLRLPTRKLVYTRFTCASLFTPASRTQVFTPASHAQAFSHWLFTRKFYLPQNFKSLLLCAALVYIHVLSKCYYKRANFLNQFTSYAGEFKH